MRVLPPEGLVIDDRRRRRQAQGKGYFFDFSAEL